MAKKTKRQRSKLMAAVVTEDRAIYEGPADSVSINAAEGQITIWAHHAALLAELKPGALVVRNDQEEHAYRASGGFVEVRDNTVTVLARSITQAPSEAPELPVISRALIPVPTPDKE